MHFLRNHEEEVREAACTDYPTGMPNLYGFQRSLDRRIENGTITSYCAFYFNISRMHLINSRYGIACGDKLLLQYAFKIQSWLEADESIARMAGDTFLALVKKTRKDAFLALVRDLPVPIVSGGETRMVHVAAVSGGYEIDSDTVSSAEILERCRVAETFARNVSHKPAAFMTPALGAEIHHRQQLEENARLALALGEFLPFYQAKVDSRTKRIIGAEALARWMHNGRLISPAEFIPLMEQSYLITELDFAMLEQVCRDIRAWLDAGIRPVEISVNFSRKNLEDPSLASRIIEVLARYAIPKGLVQIEITETFSEQNGLTLREFVSELQSKGISTAIDDFGSGNSSILLLKYADFQDLKIDKAFINYSGAMEKQLLSDIIRMAKNMQMNVIAEGVEKEEQVRELSEMGCYKIQGYFYDRPAAREEFENAWLTGADDREIPKAM